MGTISVTSKDQTITCTLGVGRDDGGRTTKWAIRCSECRGWLKVSLPTKTAALIHANQHVETHELSKIKSAKFKMVNQRQDLTAMTMNELNRLASEKKIRGRSKMTKSELCDALWEKMNV
jgi:hypothetical protein